MSIEVNERIKYLEAQVITARSEISNLRQQLNTMRYAYKEQHDAIHLKLRTWVCLNCSKHAEDNSIPSSSSEDNIVPMKEIGVVNTVYPEKRGTPRQSSVSSQTESKLTLNKDVFTNPNHSLEGLSSFSHMWILFHFHKNNTTHVRAKVAPPRLNGARLGVFATRSPHRPSPIGLSLVQIKRIEENVIYFNGADMIDQTPVLDVKPYIAQYDFPSVGNTHNLNVDLETPQIQTRQMDGEENISDTGLGNIPYASLVSVDADDDDGTGERPPPEGEEEDISNNMTNFTHPAIAAGIRTPSWIDQSPVSSLTVSFKEGALLQLSQPGGEEKKDIIINVLKEDPRSVYLRQRWSNHCYVFRICDMCVSCKFDDTSHSVTVFKVVHNENVET